MAELSQSLLGIEGLIARVQASGLGVAFGATSLGCQLLVLESDRGRAEGLLSQIESSE